MGGLRSGVAVVRFAGSVCVSGGKREPLLFVGSWVRSFVVSSTFFVGKRFENI